MGRFKELSIAHRPAPPQKPLPNLAKAKKSKVWTILRVLAEGGSLNRFDAERYGDHTLPSTIAHLQGQHELRIDRKPERVPNRYGTLTTCARYWLAPDQRSRALAILKAMHGEAPE